MTTQAIYQTHVRDATISWLSLARLDCYLHEQQSVAAAFACTTCTPKRPTPNQRGHLSNKVRLLKNVNKHI
jgi:hypothetical protein